MRVGSRLDAVPDPGAPLSPGFGAGTMFPLGNHPSPTLHTVVVDPHTTLLSWEWGYDLGQPITYCIPSRFSD